MFPFTHFCLELDVRTCVYTLHILAFCCAANQQTVSTCDSADCETRRPPALQINALLKNSEILLNEGHLTSCIHYPQVVLTPMEA